MARVLVLCTGNSCRSQMAESLFELESNSQWEGASAGSNPSGYVHPLAIEAMKELDVDLSDHRSEHLNQYLDQDFDLVVTVCDNAAEGCPVFPGAKKTLHWPFEDPADATGTDEEKLVEFRRIRDQIRQRIQTFLAEEA